MAFVYWIHLPEHTDITKEGYIGITNNTLAKRWQGHMTDSKRKPHIILYKAFKKYAGQLTMTPLVEASHDYCLEVELKLRPTEKIGWNTNLGGERGALGSKRSTESCKKQSESMKGEKHYLWGKTIPEDQVMRAQATRRANGGFEVSEETRSKISLSNKGKIRSEESRKKISLARIGMKLSPSHCENMSIARKAANLTGWKNYSADLSVWALAQEVEHMLKNKVSVSEIERRLNLKFRALMVISKKIKGGWSPTEDIEYLDWLAEYKQNKGVENAK